MIIDQKGPRVWITYVTYVCTGNRSCIGFLISGLTDCIGVSQSGSTAAFLHLMYATKYIRDTNKLNNWESLRRRPDLSLFVLHVVSLAGQNLGIIACVSGTHGSPPIAKLIGSRTCQKGENIWYWEKPKD